MTDDFHVAFLIPGDLSTRTGGYEYDRRVTDGLRRLAWDVHVVALDDSFPQPTSAALAHADAVLREMPAGRRVVIDGLALGAMPDVAAAHAGRLRLIALVHHPLALETGLPLDLAARLRESERQALAVVGGVIVTSRRTVDALADYGVHAARVTVVEPGTDAAPLARGSGDDAVQLLCVASLSPRKGHAILFRALSRLRDHAWRLVCVGGERDAAHVALLRELLAKAQIADRVDMVGEADGDHVGGYYDRSDVFVLPTWYEGYGMVVAEALARGLPVISTPTGAIADLVTAGNGMLVTAGDVDGWVDALSQVFDPRVRRQLAAGARATRHGLRNWTTVSAEWAAALVSRG